MSVCWLRWSAPSAWVSASCATALFLKSSILRQHGGSVSRILAEGIRGRLCNALKHQTFHHTVLRALSRRRSACVSLSAHVD